MDIQPVFENREAQRYAGIHEVMKRAELSENVPRILSELLTFLQEKELNLTGAPLVRYLTVDYNTEVVEIDVGVPIDAATLPANDRVHLGQIEAGTFATVVHRGSYDALVKTTSGLLAWAKDENVKWQVDEAGGRTRWNARVEHYLVGPPSEPNPESWQTEIAILVFPDPA